MKRRDFLKKNAALASVAAISPAISPLLAATLAGCESDNGGSAGSEATAKKTPLASYEYDGAIGPENLFSHGVASGDPTADAVILWTRVTLDGIDGGAPAGVEVYWEIATDEQFKNRLGAGLMATDADRDWTVKVDAKELSAATRYYYRFYLQGRGSVVGRTKTAPAKMVDALRFGVCSCARYASGYYVGYQSLAEIDDLDAVLHLGDYMYESDGGGGFRPNDPPHTTVTLSDYRRRYARQRTDESLQLMHAKHPMIAIWDDHETANNSHRDGAGSHTDSKHGKWSTRKKAGMQAWHEWLPIRDAGDNKIWRTLSYGEMCDLVMLDTRLWGRDSQTTGSKKDVLADPKRSIMGMDQETWLAEQIIGSKARWIVLGQQVMCGPLLLGGVVLNTDQWDGYQASRKRLFEAIDAKGRGNVVVLTGDIHSSWANELVVEPSTYEAGSGDAWAVEFVTPGITSGFPSQIPKNLVEGVGESNPHIRWYELGSKGFYVLHLSHPRVQADWYLHSDIQNKATRAKYSASWYTEHGKTVLHKADKAAV